jgi:hypothetical protein
MKARTILGSLAALGTAVAISYAADASSQMGTWKINEAKSKVPAGMGKNTTVVYAPAGDMVKVTVDGVDKDGKPAHNEWTGKFDGKDYPVTGDAITDMRSYKMVDDRTLDIVAKKGGKTVLTGKTVLAADGKSRTLTINATDPAGKSMTSTVFYDKQ